MKRRTKLGTFLLTAAALGLLAMGCTSAEEPAWILGDTLQLHGPLAGRHGLLVLGHVVAVPVRAVVRESLRLQLLSTSSRNAVYFFFGAGGSIGCIDSKRKPRGRSGLPIAYTVESS